MMSAHWDENAVSYRRIERVVAKSGETMPDGTGDLLCHFYLPEMIL